MATQKYLALLRGINVGGSNIIKMADLKACFEKNGFGNVKTYIQSGNVVFEAQKAKTTDLAEKIEKMLSSAFNYKAKVVIRTKAQLEAAIASAPKGFGTEPANFRYYVIFLKEPVTTEQAMREIPIKDGVDSASPGAEGVVFHTRVETKATQSHLNKLIAMPIYQNMTIRNWNTTSKLAKLMAD